MVVYYTSTGVYIPFNANLFKYTFLFNIYYGLNVVNVLFIKKSKLRKSVILIVKLHLFRQPNKYF